MKTKQGEEAEAGTRGGFFSLEDAQIGFGPRPGLGERKVQRRRAGRQAGREAVNSQ